MSEEANAARTADAVLAEARPVLRRVEPALKHPVRILAHVPSPAPGALLELRAGNAAVVVLPGVPPPRVLAGMDEGALRPVVGIGPRARADLEGVHAEVVGGVGAVLDVREGGVRRPLLAGTKEGEEVVLQRQRVGRQRDEVRRPAVEMVEKRGIRAGS